MSATDPKEAMRLHNEVEELAKQLNDAEERWCVLQEELSIRLTRIRQSATLRGHAASPERLLRRFSVRGGVHLLLVLCPDRRDRLR